MTTREDELGRTLRTLLQEEAEAMQIDTVTDSRRLRRELSRADGVRRRVALGVVAAALAVVAGVLLWAGIGDPRSVAPADDGPAPEVSTAAPFFVDVTSGKQTLMAERLWPDNLVPEEYTDVVELVPSPDGSTIAYTALGDVARVVDVGSGAPRRLTPPRGFNGFGDYPPDWSPDGTTLVFVLGTGNARTLALYDVSTEGWTQLADLDVGTTGLADIVTGFSSDGDKVLCQLPRSTTTGAVVLDVWSVPMTGGEPTRELPNAAYPMGLPDGGIGFVFPGSEAGRSAIAVADAAGERRTLVRSTSAIWDPQLSPDGARILYRDDDGRHLVDASTGEPLPLPDVVAGADSARWLDDDTVIVVPAS
jgi:WD40-like Beta Propeller Repeat